MQLGLASWSKPLAFPMIYPVRIYDKNGKCVRVVSSEELTARSLRTLTSMHVPNMRKSKRSKAAFRVYCCKNCGVKVKSKWEKALFCSIYCSGYWQKYVGTGKRKAFCAGGLNDLPELKKKLEAVIASKEIFVKDEYKPIKRSDA